MQPLWRNTYADIHQCQSLLAILRNDKNPVANWLSQLGLNYDRAIEMLYPTDKDDEQKTEEPKDFKMEPQTPDSEIPDADRQEEAENLEMAGGIEAEDDYNEQNGISHDGVAVPWWHHRACTCNCPVRSQEHRFFCTLYRII